MILIVSNGYDQSVNLVIDWLIYFKKEYLVITPKSNVIILEISLNDTFILQIDGLIVPYSTISAFWFRRGTINLTVEKPNIENEELRKYIETYLISETKALLKYLWVKLHSLPIVLGNYNKRVLNKLNVLEKAEKLGLIIPQTLITGQKDQIYSFYRRYNNIVNKSIQDIFQGVVDNTFLNSYTELITEDTLDTLSDSFFPSLVQKNIEKLFEIRVIYVAGSFKSIAIFSQNQKQSKTDFRGIDLQLRRSVFNLPNDIKVKLDQLMNSLKLNFGCIDLIYTPARDYVFLEINPLGQFNQSSKILNLGIEKQIAHYLIGNETHR